MDSMGAIWEMEVRPTPLTRTGTVIVVDDDDAVRKGLSRILKSASYSVNVFESVHQFRQAELPSGPSCIVLDLHMPGATGLDLQAELMAQEYHPPIIFLSGRGDVHSSVTAMKNGAVDFLEKPIEDSLLLATIDQAIEKDVDVRTEMAQIADIRDRMTRLTRREHQVLTHVIAGRLNKQIAIDLVISEKTVKVHRGRVMEKVCVRSVAELTRLCEKIGVVPVNLLQ